MDILQQMRLMTLDLMQHMKIDGVGFNAADNIDSNGCIEFDVDGMTMEQS